MDWKNMRVKAYTRTVAPRSELHERGIKIYCCAFDLCAVRGHACAGGICRMYVISVYGRPINCRTNAFAK